jgi:hypothetical protein
VIKTSTIVAAHANIVLTALSVSQDATLSFELAFPMGSEGHRTRAGVSGQTPYTVGYTAFRDRNYASVMPCSASDIITPSVRTVTLSGNTLSVHNGSSTGCFVLQASGHVVHEPDAAACTAAGDAAHWKTSAATATAAAKRGGAGVEIHNVGNSSACLAYGNGTPTDFGARTVTVGACGGGASSSWVVDAETSTIAAVDRDLFEQPGQRQCLTAAPPNVNNTIVQALTPPRDHDPRNCSWGPRNICYCKSLWKIFLGPRSHSWGSESCAQALALVNAATGAAVALAEVEIVGLWNPENLESGSHPHTTASVRFQAKLSAGNRYTAALAALTRRDVGNMDSMETSLALAPPRDSDPEELLLGPKKYLLL